MAERKVLRRRKDGNYEGLRYGDGVSSYDANLTPDVAKRMWVDGGYEELEEGSEDFDALRMLSGVGDSRGRPQATTVSLREGGSTGGGSDVFDVEQTYADGTKSSVGKSRSFAGALTNVGSPSVRMGPATPSPAFAAAADFRQGAPKVSLLPPQANDATMDGASNPQARMDMTAMDGPRNPNPMPRAGMKTGPKRPGIVVGMPAQGLNNASRVVQGAARPAAVSPRVAEAMGSRAASGPTPDPYGEARGRSDRNRLGVQLARAGAMVNEGLSGARYDRGAYDDLETQADAPVADFAARRGMAREDAAAAGEAEARRLRAEDYARTWKRQESQDAYGRERDKVGDTFARERLASEERRAREANAARYADRAESRAERLFRQQEAQAAREEAAQERYRLKAERDTETDAQKLGKRTEDSGNMKDDLDTIVSALNAGGGRNDLPGVGPVVSGLPEFFLSAEGTKLRGAAIRTYRNAVRMESGQTVTPQEAATALEGYGMGFGKSETAFRQGMAALAQRARRAMQNTEADFQPEVVELRRSRGGVTSADIPTPAPPSPEPTGRTRRSKRTGEVQEELSDGTWRTVTNGA